MCEIQVKSSQVDFNKNNYKQVTIARVLQARKNKIVKKSICNKIICNIKCHKSDDRISP